MTSKERMKIAIKGGIPDRIPCCPDISVMIPIKLKNKPFWEFYSYNDKEKSYYLPEFNKKLMYAYVDAVKYFGMDGWAIYSTPKIISTDISYEHKIIKKKEDRIISRTIMHTPDGDLFSDTLFTKDNSPWVLRKYIKDFKQEFRFLKYFFPNLNNIDFSDLVEMKDLVSESGIVGIPLLIPSFVHLDSIIDGGLAVIGLLFYDHLDLIMEYKNLFEEWLEKYLKLIISSNLGDEILIGASGLITWQGANITRSLSLDSIKRVTNLCKKNNIISHLHCCGKSKELVKMCAEETDLDVIEPLEKPPQGDVDLKEIKKIYGQKLALKGNLHTTIDMLGPINLLEKAAISCIEDAGENGGYILSTGDQCGSNTPFENIFKLVEVCEKYGRY